VDTTKKAKKPKKWIDGSSKWSDWNGRRRSQKRGNERSVEGDSNGKGKERISTVLAPTDNTKRRHNKHISFEQEEKYQGRTRGIRGN